MKLHVDSALCQAFGLCKEEAPDLFELDDFGYSQPSGSGEVGPDQRAAADAAIAACPQKAIRLVD